MHKINDHIRRVVDSVNELATTLTGFHYEFLDLDKYKSLWSSDPLEAHRIYWVEMLQRAHLASSTGILRTSRWLNGIELGCANHNNSIFCAAYRGLIESSADILYSVGQVPPTLAANLEAVYSALTKRPTGNVYTCPELEDKLIHFSQARKTRKSEEVPDSHRAKATTDYLEYLRTVPDIQGEPASQIKECYDLLCQIVHPSWLSVHVFLDFAAFPTGEAPEAVDVSTITLINDTDSANIDDVYDTYPDVLTDVLRISVTPCLTTLCMLNLLGIESLKTSSADQWDVSQSPDWKQFTSKLETLQRKQ